MSPDLPSIRTVLIFLLLFVAAGTGCSRESREARHLDRANRYFAQQQFEKAEVEYLNVLRLDPKDSVALLRLGAIYFDRGQISQAFPVLLKAKESNPGNADIQVKLARIYLSGGQIEKARNEAISLLEKDPANAQGIVMLADCIANPEQVKDTDQRLRKLQQQIGEKAAIHLAFGTLALRQGDPKSAEAEFRRAQALDPSSSPVHLALGTVYWLQQDLQQADREFKTAVDLAPEEWPTRLKWANFKLTAGQAEEAKRIVQHITQKAPGYTPAWSYLARVAFAEKKYDDCSALVKRILGKDPANTDAQLLRAQISLAKGQAADAVAELERLRDQFPRVAQLHYQLALAYLANKFVPKACASLGQAIALEPNFVEAILLLAELDIRRGNTSTAVTALSGLTNRSPKAERAYALLAGAYRTQNRLDDAIAVYQRWQAIAPRNYQVHYLLGLTLRQQRKASEARKAFEQTLELAPDYLPAVDQLVDLDIQDKNYPAASQRAEQQVARHPKAAAPMLLLAKVRLAQGAADQAEAALLRTIELAPDSSPAYTLLAQLYLKSNKRQQALEKLETVVAKNPKDATALLQMALLHHEFKDYAKARELYERVVGLNPKAALALNNLAYICAENLGQIEAGYKYAQKARELAPQDPAIADTLGWILFQRQEYSWALTVLQEAAEKLSAEPEVQFHLGAAHYMMGEEEAARLALRRARELKPDFSGRAKAERWLWMLDFNPADASPEAVAKLSQSLAEEPKDPIAHLRLAAIADRKGETNQALKAYQSALAVNPKAVPVRIQLGRLYAERLHDPARALEQGNAALNLAPDDPRVAHAVGQFAYRAGDHRRAYSLLQESARKQPMHPEVLFDLAMASYSLGRVAESERAMQRALEASATFSRAEAARRFLEMVSLYSNPARLRQAQARIQEVLKTEPEYGPALMAHALLREQSGQFADAQHLYENMLKRTPDFAPASRQLALHYAERVGNLDKAFEHAIKAREVFADDADLAAALGKAAYRRKEYARAVQFLRESLNKRPQDAELLYFLGMAHYSLKQKSQSKEALQKALSMKLESASGEEAKRVLAELRE